MGSNEVPVAALNQGVWLDANRHYDAERRFYLGATQPQRRHNPGQFDNPGHHSDKSSQVSDSGMSQLVSSLASEIANAREKIHNFLKSPGNPEVVCVSRLEKIEIEQKKQKQELEKMTLSLHSVLKELEFVKKEMKNIQFLAGKGTEVNKSAAITNIQNGSSNAPVDDDDEIDLFGSDEENEDEKKLKEERLKAYAEKKSKKPALVAKSSIVLDVKPWDDETDMKAMETAVRGISADGLVWGASKLVPLAYGINKLQIVCIVEDEKISVDWLQETIQEIEEMVQSVDIAAFNKL